MNVAEAELLRAICDMLDCPMPPLLAGQEVSPSLFARPQASACREPREPRSFAPSASLAHSQQRAELLRKLREFFDERGFLEVETPLLATTRSFRSCTSSRSALRRRRVSAGVARAAHEAAAGGRGDGDLSGHALVPRTANAGQLHNPEFTIVEWYRVGDDMQAGIDLLDELVQSLLGTPPAARTTYAEAFQRTLEH